MASRRSRPARPLAACIVQGTAWIALLLIRYLQLRSKMAWHLSRFIALLRHQLFVYRDPGSSWTGLSMAHSGST
jgi:hypothetical protein